MKYGEWLWRSLGRLHGRYEAGRGSTWRSALQWDLARVAWHGLALVWLLSSGSRFVRYGEHGERRLLDDLYLLMVCLVAFGFATLPWVYGRRAGTQTLLIECKEPDLAARLLATDLEFCVFDVSPS